MKKALFLFLILLLIMVSCTQEISIPEENEGPEVIVIYPPTYEYNAEGYVTKVTYYYDSGSKRYENYFDGAEPNRVIESRFYDESGNVTGSYSYEYNAEGYRTKRTEFYPSGAKKSETTFDGTKAQNTGSAVYYDEDGNVTKSYSYEYYYESEILVEVHCHEYNAEGYMTKQTWYDGSGVKKFENIVDGTEAETCLGTIYYDESGNVKESYEYKYNADGYPIKHIGYYPSGAKKSDVFFDGTAAELIVGWKYYDEAGNVTESSSCEYNSDGYQTKLILYYASGAKRSETIYDGTAAQTIISTIRYDEDGNVI